MGPIFTKQGPYSAPRVNKKFGETPTTTW